ncbi:hypothetical protein IW261DRAFT_1465473 [Armillaria novae-zelandiae]|uniref:Secreted protein n=1 Tax=Armillaria novae-zelandiae TaxID=153914 RepID=A0AA39PGW0_9AGAR|nr:hypothetical protein IW261DRAFT_1465473 [Armillaria novae-zelandiae]
MLFSIHLCYLTSFWPTKAVSSCPTHIFHEELCIMALQEDFPVNTFNLIYLWCPFVSSKVCAQFRAEKYHKCSRYQEKSHGERRDWNEREGGSLRTDTSSAS